ncbi:MAG: lamin tail domain-containing protein, partial [Planctomycetota bacterium]|nr:lamin tail domain-containing protein [Planctomycetota bacterium]
MIDNKRHWYNLPAMVCTVIFWTAQPGLGLIISEIMYHPAGNGDTLEFIELHNDRAVFEDLSDYAFTNGIGYAFESGTIIAPKSYLVVAHDPAALEQVYGITGIYGPFTGRLSNDSERIELSSGGGQIVISLRYDDDAPWPVSPDGTGHSLILPKPGGDPAEASSWSPSTFIGGTPGGPDNVQTEPQDPTLVTLVDIGHPGLYFKGIAEPSPDRTGLPTTAWTELGFNDNPTRTPWTEGPSGYGYTNEADELRFIGTQLNDMPGRYMSVYARLPFMPTPELIASFSSLSAEVHYDDGFVLYLNGTRVADSGQILGNPPPFGQSGGPATDPPVAIVDLTNRMNLLVRGTNILAIQGHNARLSGSSDCFISPILRATIGEPGGGDDPHTRVVINEMLVNSDAAAGADWIELYNPGPTTVDLSNVYLSDDRADLLKYKVPDGTVLQPGRFWTATEGMGLAEFGFGLAFAGETVYVTAATDDLLPVPVRVLDAVRYETMEPEATFGRFPDGFDSFGRLTSATFNGPNTQPLIRDIVINEIMYHHGTRDDRYEYIELHNRGTATIALSGWAFIDGISYEFDQGTEMAPGAYMVIAKDPALLETVYDNLIVGSNLVGPYSGRLDDQSERICLSYPFEEMNQETGDLELYMITADEVTYYEGGRWPTWADGEGSSLELRDPHSNNDAPDAWADSDESGKASWEVFSFTIDGADFSYTHDQVTIFDLLLLNR